MQSTSQTSQTNPIQEAQSSVLPIEKSPRRLFTSRPHPDGSLLLLPESQVETPLKEKASTPATLSVDVYQSEKEIIICAPIAGVSKDSLRIQMDSDVLSIEGRRDFPIQEETQAIVQEVYWGTFKRSIILPDFIDRSRIHATTNAKVLVIRIPKTEDFKTRLIEIDEKTD